MKLKKGALLQIVIVWNRVNTKWKMAFYSISVLIHFCAAQTHMTTQQHQRFTGSRCERSWWCLGEYEQAPHGPSGTVRAAPLRPNRSLWSEVGHITFVCSFANEMVDWCVTRRGLPPRGFLGMIRIKKSCLHLPRSNRCDTALKITSPTSITSWASVDSLAPSRCYFLPASSLLSLFLPPWFIFHILLSTCALSLPHSYKIKA